MRLLGLLPRRLRDLLYDVLARKRYALSGKNERCDMGDPSFAGRIVTDIAPGQGRIAPENAA